jgi:hypothetical protein
MPLKRMRGDVVHLHSFLTLVLDAGWSWTLGPPVALAARSNQNAYWVGISVHFGEDNFYPYRNSNLETSIP